MTRILVVDDDPILRQITTMSLQKGGFDVVAAASGAEALELFDGSIDGALLDVMMPDIDGQALLGKLLEQDPSLKAAFLTARHDLDEELTAAGARGVLRKPFDALQLPTLLRETLGV